MLGIRAGHLLQRSVLACGRAATQRALRAAPPVLSLHASATSPNAPASSELSSSLSGTSMQKRAMVKIGTHSGTFHLDEALGCYMLRLTDTYKDAEIVRSRDPAVLKELDIILDVGGVYDPATNRYDHHQREFTEKFGHGFECTKLSSAGLVYKHFGREVIAKILGIPVDHPDMEAIYMEVYRVFIEAVDAVDNGVNQWDGSAPPKYVNNTTLSARVGQLNPRWNEAFNDGVLYERFLKAVELSGREFKDCVEYVYNTWLPGRAYVQQSIQQRFEADPSGQIVRLVHYCPWKDHLYSLEKELKCEKPLLYVLYEDENEKKWRIQCVSVGPGSFENRRSLPAAWRGLRDDKLAAVCGVPDATFIHAGGFIGGCTSYNGVLEMAKKALVLD